MRNGLEIDDILNSLLFKCSMFIVNALFKNPYLTSHMSSLSSAVCAVVAVKLLGSETLRPGVKVEGIT